MKILRILGYSIAGLVVTGMIGAGFALWSYRDIPSTVLEKKYTSRTSRFINIDGARIHFRDEGNGPAILLLHASFASLIDWDPWVEALKDSYRVVRLDFPGHGLTGPDPTGDYSRRRTLALTEKFINAIDLDRFSIAGASLGGTIAIHYTHRHPERIENLILLNPGVLAYPEKIWNGHGTIPDMAFLLKYILPRALPKYMLESGFGDRTRVTDALVDRWYDLWMREGQREAQLDRLQQFRADAIESTIRDLKPRTLLLQSEANMADTLARDVHIQGLFKNVASLEIVAYPGIGEMLVLEAGPETGRDVRAFLDQSRQADTAVPAADTRD